MTYTLLLGLVLTLVSCGEATTAEKNDADVAKTTENMGNVVAKLDLSKSQINWSGTMLGVYSHEGYMKLNEGKVEIKNGKVSGGSFVANVASMSPTDKNYDPDNGKTKEGLIGHLSSGEFFDVANHPTARFDIISVDGNSAKGKLNIRGISNEEVVKNIEITKSGDNYVMTGSLTFDRQKYDVKWSSGTKESVLSDDIVLNVKLTTSI